MRIEIELTEIELRALVLEEIRKRLNAEVTESDIKIQVKTKTNYKSAEWEPGSFRAFVKIDQ